MKIRTSNPTVLQSTLLDFIAVPTFSISAEEALLIEGVGRFLKRLFTLESRRRRVCLAIDVVSLLPLKNQRRIGRQSDGYIRSALKSASNRA